MVQDRRIFEHRNSILKWYWKLKIIREGQRHWIQQYGMEPPTRLSIAHRRDKFETEGTVMGMHKGRSSKSEASSVGVLDSFTRSPQKWTSQCALETGVGKANLGCFLQKRALCVSNQYKAQPATLAVISVRADSQVMR
ncbi:hypothetical protein TNCV_3744711 [Trichonephila clavipes]|nr:hypothetical protein TNCV_3744711 [Trichonephila clavipes]